MKTATINKPLSKVNEKIIDLAQQILDIESYNANDDFNIREGSICANIKVYEWLDEDDVKNIIKSENLQSNEFAILDEFNENRLNNIYNHHCEMEVMYLKERYQDNCDLDDPYHAKKLYANFFYKDFKAWPVDIKTYRDKDGKITKQTIWTYEHKYKEAFKFSMRKNNTPENYLKHLKKKNAWQFSEWDRRALINFEVWQYGRSGGWLSICETSELEGQEFESLDYYTDVSYLEGIHDNNEFNQVLNDELEVYSKDKRNLIFEMETFISEWNQKKEAIEYYINEIEEVKKHFKSGLLERLEEEILTYVHEDLKAQESNVSIKIEANQIKTTLGVSVDLNAFKIAFRDVKPLFKTLQTAGQTVAIKRRVGNYFVEYAKKVENDILIKAGCHRFSLNNINQVLTQ